MTMGAPGEEFGEVEGGHFGGALLDDEVVDGDETGGGKTELGEHQVDTVQSEGEFVFEFGEVSLLEGGTVADDESALTFARVLERGEATNALTPPWMEVGGRELRDTAKRVIGVFDGLEEGGHSVQFSVISYQWRVVLLKKMRRVLFDLLSEFGVAPIIGKQMKRDSFLSWNQEFWQPKPFLHIIH